MASWIIYKFSRIRTPDVKEHNAITPNNIVQCFTDSLNRPLLRCQLEARKNEYISELKKKYQPTYAYTVAGIFITAIIYINVSTYEYSLASSHKAFFFVNFEHIIYSLKMYIDS